MKDKRSTARGTAVNALLKVYEGGWANMAVNSAFKAASLNSRDAAFAAAVFYGTAERLATLDYILQPFIKKPVAKLDGEVRAVLETGTYQMLYMQVPVRAAVNESVGLIKAFGKTSASGMVNAVLRRVAQQWVAGETVQEPDFSSVKFATETERVCVTWSVSKAVAEAVMGALPNDYDAFFAASLGGSELCLRTNTLKTTQEKLKEEFVKQGARVHAGALPNSLYVGLSGAVAESPLYKSGLFHVQGEASQYACACLGARQGEKVLDLCAAPGGKSATIAQELGGGSGLTSCDIHPHRVELIKNSFERLGITGAKVLQNDASVYNKSLEGQDKVLCDVPCSGLGVLRQKPDMRYGSAEGYDELPPLQLKILANAGRYVKQGGIIVYSTCTIRKQENEDVVNEFLSLTNGKFRLIPPLAKPENTASSYDMMTILPQKTGLDGFFVATMECL